MKLNQQESMFDTTYLFTGYTGIQSVRIFRNCCTQEQNEMQQAAQNMKVWSFKHHFNENKSSLFPLLRYILLFPWYPSPCSVRGVGGAPTRSLLLSETAGGCKWINKWVKGLLRMPRRAGRRVELKGAQLESVCLNNRKQTKRSKLVTEQPQTNIQASSHTQMAVL